MTKFDRKVAITGSPGQRALTAFPLHRVGTNAIHWAQTHLIKLPLARHSLNAKVEGLSTRDALDVEVEPSVVVATGGVRQAITAHPARERIGLPIFVRETLAEVA